MNTGEKTKRYAVIGHPVAHSLSPVMHNANFQACGDTDCTYESEDIAPADLERFILENPKGYSGLSVTIPHKESLFEILMRKALPVDPIAQTAKSVNTIKYVDGIPNGWSTDGIGFVRAFEEAFGTKLAGKSVLVFGTGGSARAVMAAVRRARATIVRTAGRNLDKATQLNQDLGTDGAFVLEQRIVNNDDVIINATSVGLHDDDAAFFIPSMFGHSMQPRYACDLVYAPKTTQFVEAARSAGWLTSDGVGMLLHQGAEQYRIWMNDPQSRDAGEFNEPDIEAMRAALGNAVGRTVHPVHPVNPVQNSESTTSR